MYFRKKITGAARRHFEAAGGAATAALDQAGVGSVEADRNSRLGRIGRRMVLMAFLLQATETILVVAVMTAALGLQAFAQSPSGSLFGGTDQMISEGVRSAIYWARNLLFAIGVFFGFMVPVRIYMRQGFGTAAAACVGCFGVAGLLALAYSWSQGRQVQFNPDYA